MKALKLFTLLGLVSVLATSCSSSMRMASSSAGDDIYFDPSQDASGQLAAASNGKRVPMDKSYRDLLNETNRAISDTLYEESDSTGNPYADILADDYEKAKRNRELGLRDPWNGMSTNAAYSQNMWYATAYDPAFYNVIVMGNTIWAEPKYISSMFGYPYNSPYINFGSYYSPWRNSWNYSFNFGFGWGWSSNWGWGYNNWYDPYWGGYYGWNSPWYDTPYYHSYHSHKDYDRGGVYGVRNNVRYNDNNYRDNSYSRYNSSNNYSRTQEMISGGRNSVGYSRISRGDSNRDSQQSNENTTYSRRSSSYQTRSTTNSYTPTYSRPTRSSQPVFNDGNRNGQSYERRSTPTVTPRNERVNDYTPSRGNTNNYTPSRNTEYNRSSNDNYQRSNSYTPSTSGTSSRESSGYTRSGRR